MPFLRNEFSKIFGAPFYNDVTYTYESHNMIKRKLKINAEDRRLRLWTF